jgi:hypothetical protein
MIVNQGVRRCRGVDSRDGAGRVDPAVTLGGD